MSGWNEAITFSIFASVALKGTAILSLAWVAAFLLRAHSAGARHLVWTMAAVTLVALPFLTLTLPAFQVPVVLPGASSSPLFQATGSASQEAIARTNDPQRAASSLPASVAWRPDFRIWLMLLWTVGSAAAFAPMLFALGAIWRLRRSATALTDRHLTDVLSQRLGIRRPVDVLEIGPGKMPMTFGVLRSAVFLPADAVRWSEECRRAVLLHELAHVRRGDVAAHWLARTALALYWWNPLAWIAWREFLKERERATDDLVLSVGTRASEYANHLLEIARTMQTAPLASVAMARPSRSQLEIRLRAILDSTVNRQSPSPMWSMVATFLAIAIAIPFAAVRAQDASTLPSDIDAVIRSANSQKNHEVLDNAAKAAEQLRKYDAAQQLLQSALEIRAQDSGQQSVEYGLGLLKLGDLERKRHRTESAEDFYSRAAQILGDRPEAAPALIFLGISALQKKDFAQAADRFQRAQQVDPASAASAMMWMGVMDRNQDNADQAEARFRSAVSMLDTKSPNSVTTLKVFASFLRSQGRNEEAGELESRASSLQKANAPSIVLSNGVYRIGGGVAPPKVLSKVEPKYSEEARLAKLAGTVTLSVEIGTDGLAHNPLVARSLGLGLDESAMDAVSQWNFQPGVMDGNPVPVAATIEVNFRLI